MKVWKFYLCMGEVHGRNCALLEGKMPTWAKGLQMNQKRKIQRGKSPCKISPTAECRSEPGPQDAHAGCPGFQSWHLWPHSASTLLQPPILSSVNLPLVLVSQTGPLPNPSCRLNFVHTALLFICQRALTTSFSGSWLWPCILQISQGWQCQTTFGEGLRITEWQKKGENKYFGIWIIGHPLAESLWLVLVSSHFYKLMFWRFCAQILMGFFSFLVCWCTGLSFPLVEQEKATQKPAPWLGMKASFRLAGWQETFLWVPEFQQWSNCSRRVSSLLNVKNIKIKNLKRKKK